MRVLPSLPTPTPNPKVVLYPGLFGIHPQNRETEPIKNSTSGGSHCSSFALGTTTVSLYRFCISLGTIRDVFTTTVGTESWYVIPLSRQYSAVYSSHSWANHKVVHCTIVAQAVPNSFDGVMAQE